MKINHVSFSNRFYETFMKVLRLFRVEEIRKSLELKTDDIILDCGAGSGYYAKKLQKYVSKIYALDASEDFEIKVKETKNMRVIKQECPPIPFDDHFFNKIYMADVIHHIEKETQKSLLKEFFRILKPNGILSILDFDTKNSLFGKIIYGFEKIIGFPCTFIQSKQLRKILQNIGFEVEIIKINKHIYIAKCVKSTLFSILSGKGDSPKSPS